MLYTCATRLNVTKNLKNNKAWEMETVGEIEGLLNVGQLGERDVCWPVEWLEFVRRHFTVLV